MSEGTLRDTLLEEMLNYPARMPALIDTGDVFLPDAFAMAVRNILRQFKSYYDSDRFLTWQWLCRYQENRISVLLGEECINGDAPEMLRNAILFDSKETFNVPKIRKILDETSDDELLTVMQQVRILGFTAMHAQMHLLKGWCEVNNVDYERLTRSKAQRR